MRLTALLPPTKRRRGFSLSIRLAIAACLCMRASAQQDVWEPIGPFGGVSRFLVNGPHGFIYTSFENTGLFRSSDDGERWYPVMNGISEVEILSFCSAPDGRILCGGYGTVYESSNDGESWQNVADLSGIGDADVQAIAVNQAGHIFVASDWMTALFRSVNHGQSWQMISGIPTWGGVGIGTTLRVAPDSSLIVGTSGAGIFRVQLGSDQAMPISYNLPKATAGALPYGPTSGFEVFDDGSVVLSYYPRVRVLPPGATQWSGPAAYFSSTTLLRTDDSTLYAFGWTPVFLSTDRGSSWRALTDPMRSLPFQSLVTTSSGAFLVGQFRSSLLRSVDSLRTCTPSDNGIVRTDINCVLVTPAYTVLAGTAHGGIFRTSDGGKSWAAPVLPGPAGGADYIVDICRDSHGAVYAASMMHNVWRSMNDGNTWEETGFSDSLTMQGIDLRITDMTVTPDDGILVSGFTWYSDTLGGIYRSRDQGVTWERTLSAPDGSGAQSFLLLSDSVAIAGTRDSGFFRTTDGGKSWSSSIGVFPSITSMVSDSAHILIAASMGLGVIRSTDSGISWAQSNNGLGNLIVRTVKSLPGGILFAGTEVGGFASIDHGMTWTDVGSSNLGGVRSVFRTINGDVYLVTEAGLYRGSMTTSVPGARNERLVGGPVLFSNYPNPFNSTTVVRYSVAPVARRDLVSANGRDGQVSGISAVKLRVYDLLGREVAVLVNEQKPTGVYTVTWNAANMPSGVYFSVLTCEGQRFVGKLMLLK